MQTCAYMMYTQHIYDVHIYDRAHIHIYMIEHIELPANLLDYFLRTNNSNINT